jgi:predicted phosphoadenosine phosphosulfate sulfurtransferase
VKTGKKQRLTRNVYDLALDRLRLCFDRFDKVVVSFSGGKDSTACVQLALQVARETGRLPLDVYTFDEEAIPPETVDYMARVATNPDIRFHWYCLPVEHRNACSRTSPVWWPWTPEARPLWVRDLPLLAITELAGFRRQPIPEVSRLIWGPQFGTVCIVMGIRTQESLSRYHAVAVRRGFEAFLSTDDAKHVRKAYPIYDWHTDDVWLAPHLFGWDYNRAYDVMEAAGLHRLEARCSPPYGEQPIRRLWAYKVCWPDLWARMTTRVPGAATAARYANTDLYGINMGTAPAGAESWRDRTHRGLVRLTQDAREAVAKCLKISLAAHYRFTGDPLPDGEPHLQSGYCWKLLYTAVAAGGNKFDRQQQKIFAAAKTFRVKHEL